MSPVNMGTCAAMSENDSTDPQFRRALKPFESLQGWQVAHLASFTHTRTHDYVTMIF
jgi:hypothetical protein